MTPGLVRLAVGIESIEDILADLDAGFAAAKRRLSRKPSVRHSTLPVAALPPPDGRLGNIPIGALTLENGAVLPARHVAVQRWGELSPNRDNVVLVEHALTGDSHVIGPTGPEHPTPGWWEGMVGPGAPIDTRRVVCRCDQRARRLPGHDRAGVDRSRRAGVGVPLPEDQHP